MEYVDVAWATKSTSPADRISTSPTAKRLPSFTNLASQEVGGAGLAQEIDAEIGRHCERRQSDRGEHRDIHGGSASAIIVGPDMVPPGRMKSTR
jgi:hypothetical protein